MVVNKYKSEPLLQVYVSVDKTYSKNHKYLKYKNKGKYRQFSKCAIFANARLSMAKVCAEGKFFSAFCDWRVVVEQFCFFISMNACVYYTPGSINNSW